MSVMMGVMTGVVTGVVKDVVTSIVMGDPMVHVVSILWSEVLSSILS